MMTSRRKTIWVYQVIVLVVLSACGLATSNEERVARAGEQVASGDYRAAMIDLKNVLASDADNVDARLLLAEVSLGLGDVLAAEKELARAAELHAPEAEVRPLQMRILLGKGDFAGVLAALGTMTGGLTDDQQLSYRGEALLGLGKADAAAVTYQAWLDKDATSVAAALGLANAVAAQGDNETAVASLEELARTAPDDFRVWQVLGAVRLQSGDFEGAATALGKAADAIRPQTDVRRYAAILTGLTEARLVLGKNDDARLSLGRLMGVAPESPAALFLAARLARSENDYALASRYLQTLLNVSPDNSQAQLFLAYIQMLQGNYAQAENLLGRVVARSPDNMQARKLLAQVQLNRSQPSGAIEALAPILEDAGEDRDIYELLAQVSLQQGDAQSAIENFRAAVKSAPDDVEAKLNLAAAYLHAGEAKQAFEALGLVDEGEGANFRRESLLMQTLVTLGDDDAAARLADRLLSKHGGESAAVSVVAGYYLNRGDTDRARAVLKKHVDSGAATTTVIVVLARLDLATENYDEAEQLLDRVLEAEPDNLAAALGKARIAEVRGDADGATSLLLQAAGEHPGAVAPRVWLVSRYLASKQLRLAEDMADELVGIGFHNARVSQIVGKAFMEAGRVDDALLQFNNAARLAPESPGAWFDVARANVALDRTVEAREALEKTLNIRPDWLPARAVLALVELRQGNLDAALLQVQELRSTHPDNPSVALLEGEIYFHVEKFEQAAAAFHRAVAGGAGRLAVLKEFQARANGRLADPDSPVVEWLAGHPQDLGMRIVLAEFYQTSDARDKAVEQYENILTEDPDNVPVLNNLAWQYQQRGDLDTAYQLADKAYQLDQNSGSIADTLAWILKDKGELDRSRDLLASAVKLSPQNGEIQYHYAVLLSETGDNAQARRILEKLENENVQFPSRKQAAELLGRLTS